MGVAGFGHVDGEARTVFEKVCEGCRGGPPCLDSEEGEVRGALRDQHSRRFIPNGHGHTQISKRARVFSLLR